MCGCKDKQAVTTAGAPVQTGLAVERMTMQTQPRLRRGYGVGALIFAVIIGVLIAKAVKG